MAARALGRVGVAGNNGRLGAAPLLALEKVNLGRKGEPHGDCGAPWRYGNDSCTAEGDDERAVTSRCTAALSLMEFLYCSPHERSRTREDRNTVAVAAARPSRGSCIAHRAQPQRYRDSNCILRTYRQSNAHPREFAEKRAAVFTITHLRCKTSFTGRRYNSRLGSPAALCLRARSSEHPRCPDAQ